MEGRRVIMISDVPNRSVRLSANSLGILAGVFKLGHRQPYLFVSEQG